MPTYTVTTANLALSPQQKSRIADAITTAHSNQTGAPRFFAQVIFSAVAEGDHFVGGKGNSEPQLFVSGLIREGRSDEVKQALMSQMLVEITATAGVSATHVWIYLQDIPATQMMEFGRFLPAPGQEEAWIQEMNDQK
ncbi:tautomerase family protein [Marinobacter sp.]|uniref:tautomerase family protein n=1 Tax=Marinobacter sp. TaxID=50741 RepID=UPI00384C60CE